MKKLLCFILIAALCLCFASGCNTSQPDPSESAIPVFEVEADIVTAIQPGYVNVQDFGTVVNDNIDDAPALTAAVAHIQETGDAGTLWFPSGVYTLDSAWNLPLGFECVFEKGATLNIKSNTPVQFNGTVTAGFHTVFDGEFEGMLDNEQVFPQWFGAKGDGKTEDTNAFYYALKHTRNLAIPNTADGYLLGRVKVPYMSRIHGYNGKYPTIYGVKDTNCIFELVDGSNQSVLYDMIFRMGGCDTGTCFFFNTAGVQALTHIEIYNVYAEGAYNLVKDAHISGAIISDVVVRDVVALNSRGIAFDTDNFWGFCFLRDSVFDQSGLTEAYGAEVGNCPIVQIGDNAGFIIQNNVLIGSGDANRVKEVGFDYINNVATWMDNCEVRNTGSHAFNISGGSHLYFSKVRAKNMFGDGFVIAGSLQMQALDLLVEGRTDHSDEDAVQTGIRLTNSIDSQLDGVSISNVNGTGMLVTGSGTSITRLNIQNATRIGLINSGERVIFSDVTIGGCKTNLQMYSENSMLVNAILGGQSYQCIKEIGNY